MTLNSSVFRPAAKILVLAVLVVCAGRSQAAGVDQAQATETARLLAILFDSGRVAVGKNQELLNDASKGPKGFTPAVFEKQMLAEFQRRTGVNLAESNADVPEMAKPLLARLVEESSKTIASYQPVIDLPGVRYKGLIPATFGTETAARFQNWSGIYLRQIAPDHLLRNPKNKPDDFEARQLRLLASKFGATEEPPPQVEVTDGGRTLRLLLPLYYSKACLDCHGAPRGHRDVSGYPREGAKEGDLGGAISVRLPLQ